MLFVQAIEYFKIMFRQKKGGRIRTKRIFLGTYREKIGLLFLLFVMHSLKVKIVFYLESIHHLGYGECRAPLFLEYVQADIPITVYIWMEHLGPEGNLQANLYRRIYITIFFLFGSHD
jgi:hypothetical protein